MGPFGGVGGVCEELGGISLVLLAGGLLLALPALCFLRPLCPARF